MTLTESARARARENLSPLGQRWTHVRGVVQRAALLTLDLCEAEREIVSAAAWLHDVGYTPDIAGTGFHPLDGARYVRAEGFPAVVVGLVAYHSGAVIEARERGLAIELAEIPAPPAHLLRRLTAADMTTSPAGLPIAARERIAEILTRYPNTTRCTERSHDRASH
ncbi:HD domain-containing protein [Pengzhenrongella sicca]|uniref:HD domain-containing protein n=1 Tax=Pengzhenrongella sicca TaxID=2819238 RepID=A0A8A4ZB19_9MICO|nr:HD domain-containing protein [Pengzhenrongella sicca]QTE28611.1 HD domain-containing protein [Pengzhenrongella sicca]